MMQFEYDDSDGEIRAMIEYPLEDAELTEDSSSVCQYIGTDR